MIGRSGTTAGGRRWNRARGWTFAFHAGQTSPRPSGDHDNGGNAGKFTIQANWGKCETANRHAVPILVGMPNNQVKSFSGHENSANIELLPAGSDRHTLSKEHADRASKW
jgi:hypothetical protein